MHKRAQAFHRRGAKQCMRDLAELEKSCRELGIELTYEGEDSQEGSWPRKKTS